MFDLVLIGRLMFTAIFIAGPFAIPLALGWPRNGEKLSPWLLFCLCIVVSGGIVFWVSVIAAIWFS